MSMEGEEPILIYKDSDLIAVNKPAGLLVHALPRSTKHEARSTRNSKFVIHNSGVHESTLVDWLLARYPAMGTVGDEPKIRPGIVHRLDRDTSGVMVIARTQEAFTYLKSLFAGRKMRKTYLAWVFGKFKEREGVVAAPIGIVSGSTRRSTRSRKMAKEAVTRYTVEREITKGGESFSLLKVAPETGRTHQIRVHCVSIGHPIVGDALYTRRKNPAGHTRLMLHALSLELPLPSGSMMHLEAEPPEEFAKFAQ